MTDEPTLPIRVAALYRFTPFPDVDAIRARLLGACEAAGIKGSLLIAQEGINGTIAGSDAAIEQVLRDIRALPGCEEIEVRFSRAAAMPFDRMKVRPKREIVTMGQPDLDPIGAVGRYVPPGEWNALVDDPDTILIDTRNDYEVAIGTFKGAIDPKTKSFRDFPAWFRAERERLGQAPRVAMFCTGGIRCEKATAFVRAEGIDEVYHLKGGILAYLEQVPEAESRWEGECFVFDQRVAVGHGLAPGTHVSCAACGHPVGPGEQASLLYVEGKGCPACTPSTSPRT